MCLLFCLQFHILLLHFSKAKSQKLEIIKIKETIVGKINILYVSLMSSA